MDEKKRKIWDDCTIIGLIALFIFTILQVVNSSNTVLLELEILFAGITVIAYAIKLVVEISNHDSYWISVLILTNCLYNIVINVMQL